MVTTDKQSIIEMRVETESHPSKVKNRTKKPGKMLFLDSKDTVVILNFLYFLIWLFSVVVAIMCKMHMHIHIQTCLNFKHGTPSNCHDEWSMLNSWNKFYNASLVCNINIILDVNFLRKTRHCHYRLDEQKQFLILEQSEKKSTSSYYIPYVSKF